MTVFAVDSFATLGREPLHPTGAFDPVLRPPYADHLKPRHYGYKVWCPRCVELKTYVDQVTGKATPWTDVERRGHALL